MEILEKNELEVPLYLTLVELGYLNGLLLGIQLQRKYDSPRLNAILAKLNQITVKIFESED